MCFCRRSSSITLLAYSFPAWMLDTFELPMISMSTWDVFVVGVFGFSWWQTEMLLAAVFVLLGWYILQSAIVGRILSVDLQPQSHYFVRFFGHFNFTFFSPIFFWQQYCFGIVQMIFCALVMFNFKEWCFCASWLFRSAIFMARSPLAFVFQYVSPRIVVLDVRFAHFYNSNYSDLVNVYNFVQRRLYSRIYILRPSVVADPLQCSTFP